MPSQYSTDNRELFASYDVCMSCLQLTIDKQIYAKKKLLEKQKMTKEEKVVAKIKEIKERRQSLGYKW